MSFLSQTITRRRFFRSLNFSALLIFFLIPFSGAAQSLRELFRSVNPAVVVVRTETKSSLPELLPGEADEGKGLGSGVLISADGKVLTAAHVVQTADRITVEFLGGEQIPARVVASAPFADVALLQLERVPANAVIARSGDSDAMEVGDQIFVIGAPYGVSHSLSVGYISARRKPEKIFESLSALEVLQTDAAIYSGNSGGPMFNLKGEVIGIISHVLARGTNTDGLGFAVTSNVARKLVLEEKSFWTGVEAYLVEGSLAELMNVPQASGLLVQSIAEGSPADRLGLRESTIQLTLAGQTLMAGGDIILEMAGQTIGTGPQALDKIQQRIRALQAGEILTVKVLRAGKILELGVPLPATYRP